MGMMDCLIDDASGPVRGGWRGDGGEDFESVPLVRTHGNLFSVFECLVGQPYGFCIQV